MSIPGLLRLGPPLAALAAALSLSLAVLRSVAGETAPLVEVGSKTFTESVLLGEMAAQLIRSGGVAAEHHRALGGTRILWSALLAGEIDVYPEYTGTLRYEILADRALPHDQALAGALAEQGVRMTRPLGFNNTYAVGMQAAVARQLGIVTITDLQRHPRLRFGFTNEFMDREDGWPGLRRHYALPQTNVRGLDHDLAYRGLVSKSLDATDLYATDAEIRHYGLRVLEDELDYFPDYHAVLLYRADLEQRLPQAVSALRSLEGTINAPTMIALNERVKLEGQSESAVAASFLARTLPFRPPVEEQGRAERIATRTREHLALVAVSLGAAILAAVPLGILCSRRRRLGQIVLAVVGVVQTIPSLAVLVFMIPLLGIGTPPALAALFLYSLLPIVRNTHAGLAGISPALIECADAMGLPRSARLRTIELPLAARSILAGIKTSAVINVGTATLGALIGAGGYGQPILTGIRLDNVALILEGAVPAALLALLVQGVFDLIERLAVPQGLRPAPRS